MNINKAKSSAYNTVNTDAICGYIKEYSGEISAMIEDETKLENVNRAILKQCAAELETVVKRLKYGMNGTY